MLLLNLTQPPWDSLLWPKNASWRIVLSLVGVFFLGRSAIGLEVLSFEVLDATTINSEAAAVSSDGSVIVGRDMDQAVRWMNGELKVIHELDGMVAWPYDVSGDGTVIIGEFVSPENSPNKYQGFSWNNGTLTPLDSLPDETESHAIAVSSDGNIIVGVTKGNDGEAVYWQEGQIHSIQQPVEQVLHSQANDVSSDGSVIVGLGIVATQIQNVSKYYAWSFRNGTSSQLWQGTAAGVSGDGKVIVGYDVSVDPQYKYINPLKWRNGIIQTLPILPDAISGYAFHTNKNGSVIVGSCRKSDYYPYGEEGVIWVQKDGFIVHSLNTLLDSAGIERNGFIVTHAQNINEGGTAIVGIGTLPDGQERGFLVRLAPPLEWGAFPLENGYADTGNWLGWVFSEHDPWIWSPSMNAWLYVPSQTRDAGQGWVYLPN